MQIDSLGVQSDIYALLGYVGVGSDMYFDLQVYEANKTYIEWFDAAGTNTNVDHLPFAFGVPHVVSAQYDGANVTLKIDGTTVLTAVGAANSDHADKFELRCHAHAAGDAFTIDNVEVSTT